MDEGADRNSVGEQKFGDVPAGLTLPASGRSSDEDQLMRHNDSSFTSDFAEGTLRYRARLP